MSITGLRLRYRIRRTLVLALDAVIHRLDEPSESTASPPVSEPEPTPSAAAISPATAPTPVATPEPKPVKPKLAPLPEIPKVLGPPPKPTERPKPAPRPAAKKTRATAEERQAKHWARTRRGVLSFVGEQGGEASLRDMHDYSESTFFVAHASFSRLMEELTDEGLLDFDHDTSTATLTAAGTAALG